MIITVPTSKDFTFVVDKEKEDCPIRPIKAGEYPDPDLSFSVSFRQATREQIDARIDFLSKRKMAYDADEGVMVQIDELNDNGMHREEVALTITACDLQLPDKVDNGKGIALTFVPGVVPKLGNKAQFLEWWGLLPDQWASAVHEACLEVNPKWDAKRTLPRSTN